MKVLYKQTVAGLKMLLVLTVLLGVVYPLAVWAVARIPGLSDRAEGSIVTQNGQAVGSSLIGVDPVAKDPAHDPYFHNRPSAGSKDPLGPGDPSTSGASNKGTGNEDLLATVKQRQELIAKREGVDVAKVPADAVSASASGLDPQISPAYAELQVPRVARENGLSEDEVRKLVAGNTTGRGLGVLGDPGVNVLQLNLAVAAARH
ncbi:K(+)-transporting ATPase subunit C [Amycolatopsis sp. NPDC004625]|uniref:K(+)-transporting ATPase subunit C n=1 Tax=Amycolatopsis sp. NPDC004625 TaxID=3154670 RepID=UPI0033BD2BF8